MRTLLFFLTLFLSFLFINTSYSQETVLSAGGDISSSGGSASQSIGQVFYQIHSDDDISLHEGVQQPFEISIINGISRIEAKNYDLTVYPNPTLYDLYLKINSTEFENLTYQFYSMEGKLLVENSVNSIETTIPIENYTPGFYLLKVYSHNQEIQSFKIIKQ